MKKFAVLLLAFALAIPVMLPAHDDEAGTLVVYSARKEHLIKPLFDIYTQKTGVEIEYLTDKEGPLLARLQAEGELTAADMLITVDAGNLWHAADKQVLRPIKSDTLAANVPAHLHDSKARWFGLSIRARTVVYATDRVKPSELSTYEDLASAKWQGRLCLRTSKKVYNQSLVSSMISNLGEVQTETIVEGWVANLAAPVFSSDNAVLEAIAAGQCDVGVVNTYYFGRMQKQKPDIKLALFWPNQEDRGVHVNVSGAGITQHAKNPEEAQRLLEWLSGEEAQQLFAGLNQEYPVNAKVSASDQVKSWGEFSGDKLPIEKLGELQVAAVKLMDRAGYR